MSEALLGEEGGLGAKKRALVLAVVGCVALGVLGGAGWLLKDYLAAPNEAASSGNKASFAAGEDIKQAAEKRKSFVAPTFVPFDPYIVNLAAPDDERYMQIVVVYQVNNDRAVEALKAMTPLIRSRSLMVLSKKNAEYVQSLDGKQRLMDELLDVARVTLQQQGGSFQDNVLDVHFSSLVVQ
jgi:flagellar protein FliL